MPLLFGDREIAQTDVLLGGMRAGSEAELEPVPRTGDVQVLGVEFHAATALLGVQHLAYTGDEASLADRSTLVRTPVLVGVQRAAEPEHADRGVGEIHNVPAAFGDDLAGAHQV